MKRIISIIIFISSFFSNLIYAQFEDTYNFFLKFTDLYNSGDFINAEECMFSVLNSKEPPPEDYIIAAYNNLGLIKKNLGLYKEAIDFYSKDVETYMKIFLANRTPEFIFLLGGGAYFYADFFKDNYKTVIIPENPHLSNVKGLLKFLQRFRKTEIKGK